MAATPLVDKGIRNLAVDARRQLRIRARARYFGVGIMRRSVSSFSTM